MNRIVPVGALLAIALAAVPTAALDSPHGPAQGKSCQDCHLLHNAAGGALTKVAGNANLCDSCHGSIVDTDGKHFGFPWTPADQAVPGTSGRSHRWDAAATNRGANVPASTAMSSRLDAGKLTCSVCHDQHSNAAGGNTGTQHVGGTAGAGSVSVGSSWTPNGPVGAGTGTMKLEAVTAAAAPKGYRVRVNAVSGTQITYDVSHDSGRTWFPGAAVNVPSAAIDLDDGTNVQVSFGSAATAYRVNDYWEFWVSYPMLRMSNADGAMCVECHVDRNMRWQDVEGGNANGITGGVKTVVLGTTVFSHPVAQALNANTRNYDRTAATLLDVTGEAQATSTDANKTNDLSLGTGGMVTCLTCHDPHNADSNSLTVDPR